MAEERDQNTRIYEFLYRGHEPGSGRKPSWHVWFWRRSIVQATRKDKWLLDDVPLSVEQAAEEGWYLSSVLAEVNAEALLQLENMQRENERLTSDLRMSKARIAELENQPIGEMETIG